MNDLIEQYKAQIEALQKDREKLIRQLAQRDTFIDELYKTIAQEQEAYQTYIDEAQEEILTL